MVFSHFAKRVSRRTVPVAEVLKMALGGCDTNIVTQAEMVLGFLPYDGYGKTKKPGEVNGKMDGDMLITSS